MLRFPAIGAGCNGVAITREDHAVVEQTLSAAVPVQEALRIGARRRRWSWGQYLAIAGLPVLVWDIWMVVAWLADGPFQITEYRTPGSLSWWACRAFEAAVWVSSLCVLVYLVRDCRRRRRFLTFDVSICLAGLTMWWADAFSNWFVPNWLPSSNFINTNYVLGHAPFV